jgi:small-conductance mechanosensitive channel
MDKKNNNSSEILSSAPYVWSHLSVVIFFHSLSYALLRAAGYGEDVSLYLTMLLVLIDIILPNLRFPLAKEARERFHYAIKYTFPFSLLIYTLTILFAFLSKIEMMIIIILFLIISEVIIHVIFFSRRKKEEVQLLPEKRG